MIKARYRVIRGRMEGTGERERGGKSRYNNKHEYETMRGRKGAKEERDGVR